MVEIERARIKDHGIVSGLLINALQANGWKPEVDRDRWDRVLAVLLDSGGWLFLLARYEDRPVGLAAVNYSLSLYGSREQARLAAMVVEEEYRRRGIGTELMESVLSAVRRRACRELEVVGEPGAGDVLDFYRRFNFTVERVLLARPGDA